MMKKILFPFLFLSMGIVLGACNEDTGAPEEEPAEEGEEFDGAAAIAGSEAQLGKLLQIYESQEVLGELEDKTEVIENVNTNLAPYFTASFKEKVNDALNMQDNHTYHFHETFFLESDNYENTTMFRNDYLYEVREVNEETETVTLFVEADRNMQKRSMLLDMVKEEGTWKIDNAR